MLFRSAIRHHHLTIGTHPRPTSPSPLPLHHSPLAPATALHCHNRLPPCHYQTPPPSINSNANANVSLTPLLPPLSTTTTMHCTSITVPHQHKRQRNDSSNPPPPTATPLNYIAPTRTLPTSINANANARRPPLRQQGRKHTTPPSPPTPTLSSLKNAKVNASDLHYFQRERLPPRTSIAPKTNPSPIMHPLSNKTTISYDSGT